MIEGTWSWVYPNQNEMTWILQNDAINEQLWKENGLSLDQEQPSVPLLVALNRKGQRSHSCALGWSFWSLFETSSGISSKGLQLLPQIKPWIIVLKSKMVFANNAQVSGFGKRFKVWIWCYLDPTQLPDAPCNRLHPTWYALHCVMS